MARRVARNSLWLIGQPLLMNVLSILSTAYIARKLGAADYGTFNLGYAQIALFIPICNLGVRAVAVRAVAQDPENAAATIRAVFALRLLFTGAAVLLALAWLCLPTYSTTTRLIGLAAVYSMVCSSLGMVAVDLFQGFERSRLGAQPQLVGGLTLTVLSVLALIGGLGLPGFVAAYLIGHSTQLLLLHGTAFRHFFALRPAWDWPRIRGLLHQMRAFAVLGVVGVVAEPGVTDVLVLGAVLGSDAVGPYTAAVGLIARLLMIPFGIGDALFPAVAGAWSRNRPEAESAVRRYLFNALAITLPAALCISLTAPTVLWLLYGEEYQSASTAMRIAAWLLPLTGLSYLTRQCLAAVHRQRRILAGVAVHVLLLSVLLALLVPPYAFAGAASAAVGAEAAPANA
jgi:O-antigen/teichoic acid export membrane protein